MNTLPINKLVLFTEDELKAIKLRISPRNVACVYSAVFGNYDVVNDPEFVEPDVDYWFFTDREISHLKTWNVITIDKHGINPQLLAKFFKINPHLFFGEYEKSFWVDGNLKLKNKITGLLAPNDVFTLFKHQKRTNIIEEAKACEFWCKDNKKILRDQIRTYLNRGYYHNNKLYSGAFLARKHNNQKVKTLMELWWTEISTKSIRDQISLPYVVWDLSFEPTVLNDNVRNNQYFDTIMHKKPFANDGSFKGWFISIASTVYMLLKNLLLKK